MTLSKVLPGDECEAGPAQGAHISSSVSQGGANAER